MSIQNKSMGWKIFLLVFLAMLITLPLASAIPETDLYKFTEATRFTFEFDLYRNDTYMRSATVRHFGNETSKYYYVVIRSNVGDVLPYDEFDVSFACNGDETETIFTTTNYNSWVESGQVSFKHEFGDPFIVYYGFLPTTVVEGQCNVTSASGLVVDGNAGYTTFNFELVPLQDTSVLTVQLYCEDEARRDLIEAELNGTYTILSSNINIFYVGWLIFQIIAILLIFVGIPVLFIIMVSWVYYNITGRRLIGGHENE